MYFEYAGLRLYAMAGMPKSFGFRGRKGNNSAFPFLKRNTCIPCRERFIQVRLFGVPVFISMIKSKSKFTLTQLCFMAFAAVFGFFSKPIFSPAINLITDFVRIPGGSVTAGISMLFIVYACAVIKKFGTATLMGFTQAVMALGTGFSSVVGLLALITNTLPGLAIDFVLCTPVFNKLSLKSRMCLAGSCGVLAGAISTNMLYYRLSLIHFYFFIFLAFYQVFSAAG